MGRWCIIGKAMGGTYGQSGREPSWFPGAFHRPAPGGVMLLGYFVIGDFVLFSSYISDLQLFHSWMFMLKRY